LGRSWSQLNSHLDSHFFSENGTKLHSLTFQYITIFNPLKYLKRTIIYKLFIAWRTVASKTGAEPIVPC
jgi:hypothetical protein